MVSQTEIKLNLQVMKRTTSIFFFALAPLLLFSQIKVLEQMPFEEGEKISYQAVYKWGFIEIKAGLVEFSVEKVIQDNEPCYHFKSIGNSIPKYDWIFTVRDTFQSIVRERDFQPIFYERHTYEGGYEVLNKTFFEEENDQIKMELYNSDKDSSSKTIPFEKGLLDLQTAVYFARLLDFSKAEMGEEYLFNILVDGAYYKIPIRYDGLESIELNNKEYPCFKISTEVIEGTIFRSHQRINIWVTNDGKQIPVLVEAPIIIGRVKAELVND